MKLICTQCNYFMNLCTEPELTVMFYIHWLAAFQSVMLDGRKTNLIGIQESSINSSDILYFIHFFVVISAPLTSLGSIAQELLDVQFQEYQYDMIIALVVTKPLWIGYIVTNPPSLHEHHFPQPVAILQFLSYSVPAIFLFGLIPFFFSTLICFTAPTPGIISLTHVIQSVY